MANSRESRLLFARLYKAGKSLRAVRSPVAPKITITQGPVWRASPDGGFSRLGSSCSICCVMFFLPIRRRFLLAALFDVTAKLLSHGREKFFSKSMIPARAEPGIERG